MFWDRASTHLIELLLITGSPISPGIYLFLLSFNCSVSFPDTLMM
ncbi:rCG47134 [Rattus norvegicus]|uniref:RCG47134 n=1 Tax=Rattus norvegicus TaxID=10116 RepID=A6I0A7_RAT|nr:rCG47134 [Rattus norvegicus]